jgi:translation initiation factor 3 subunit B
MEPGYRISDFRGAEISVNGLEKFKQFLWRPRPRTLLSKEEQKAIRKNLRDYSRQFEELDQLESANVSQELVNQRRRLIEEWDAWRQRVKRELEEEREALGRPPPVAARNEVKEETETVEEWVEDVLEETEEVVG